MPRTGEIQSIRFDPSRLGKGGTELIKRAHKSEIDWITRKSIPGNGKTRHVVTLEDFKPHSDCARKDDIGRDAVSHAERQYWRCPMVDEFEDVHDQPNAESAEGEDSRTLQKANDCSHGLATPLK